MKRVLARSEPFELKPGDLLNFAGRRIEKIYFPECGVISTIANFTNGDMIEMANVGREGCSGIGVILGGRIALVTDLVQIEGRAQAIEASALPELLSDIPKLESVLAKYVQAYIYQLYVAGACNGTHGLSARLARWLCTMRDRSDDDELRLTQDFLAEMLGVRRPSITIASRRLQADGLIECGRGRVRILDLQGLREASCECYRMVREAYTSLLPRASIDSGGARPRR